jgi:site-specific DNA recombinase
MAVVHKIEPEYKIPDLPAEIHKRNVAVYARVSTEKDEQQTSLLAQMDYYQLMIKDHSNWNYVGTYADDGISGTGIKRRRQFQQMIQDCKDGKIDLILTKSISRFARNTVDAVKTLRELKEIQVEVYFQKENIWTGKSEGEFLLTLMSSLAQEESRSMSENIAWGQRKRFSDGGYSVAYSRFLGYDEGMVVNQQEAAVVRKIYRYFIAGHSTHDIAKILTRQEIPTPSNKSTWTDGVVKGILENEKYKGDALLQKGYTENYLTKKVVKNNGELPQYYVTDGHKAIINREMFDYVQTEMKNRERSGYFLSSHFYSARIFCGTCAAKYGSKFWHHSSAHQALVWSCKNRDVKSIRCKNLHIYNDQMDQCLEVAIFQIVNSHKRILTQLQTLIKKNVRDSDRAAQAMKYLQNELKSPTGWRMEEDDLGIICGKITVFGDRTMVIGFINGEKVTVTVPRYCPKTGEIIWPEIVKKKERSKKMTEEQMERITEFRESGYGYAGIAKILGLTKGQVSSYCRRNGMGGIRSDRQQKRDYTACFCKNCGKPIQQKTGVKQIKFCSHECCQKWWNKHPKAIKRKSTAYYTFTCVNCGREFTAYGNSHRKYCSHECYIADRFGIAVIE